MLCVFSVYLFAKPFEHPSYERETYTVRNIWFKKHITAKLYWTFQLLRPYETTFKYCKQTFFRGY